MSSHANNFSSGDTLSLDSVFKVLPGAYVVLLPDTPKFSICFVSDGYLQTAGITREELNEKGVLKICQEKSRPNDPVGLNNLLMSLNRTIETKKNHQIETIKNDPHGSEKRFCRLLNTPILDQGGNLTHILHSVTDITHEKQLEDEKAAQQALEESEERFRIAIEVADLATWDYNPLSGELLWNNRYKEIFGLPADAFVDDSVFRSGLHPDDIDRVEASVARALSSDTQEKYEIEYRTIGINKKRIRWLRAKGKAFFNEKGEPYRFIGTALDITDQKDMIGALQKSELLFRSISNAAPIALFMTDAQGDTFFLNETWLKWTGKSLESQLKRGWLEAIVDEDREKGLPEFASFFEKRESFNYEYRIKRANGQIRWHLINASPYYNETGEFAGFAGSVIDIHERKEEELRKNDFIAMASHELKTPLTSIKGYIQIMETRKDADSLFATVLPKASNQINKMTMLIRDFLDLSKMESGKFNLSPTRFNFNELVCEMIENIQPLVKHQFIINQPQVIYVEADREKIGQVITNFLDNAVKYSPNNEPVQIFSQLEGNNVKFSVTDKGIGIREDEKDKIFQRFYRAEVNNKNAFSGFGIGLYLCSEIIKRHNGQTGLESKENEGSTFYFKLPLTNLA